MFHLKYKNTSHFYTLEVRSRGSETQLHVFENYFEN